MKRSSVHKELKFHVELELRFWSRSVVSVLKEFDWEAGRGIREFIILVDLKKKHVNGKAGELAVCVSRLNNEWYEACVGMTDNSCVRCVGNVNTATGLLLAAR